MIVFFSSSCVSIDETLKRTGKKKIVFLRLVNSSRLFQWDEMKLIFLLLILALGLFFCCCAYTHTHTLRRAQSDIIVKASGDEITVMERERPRQKKKKKRPSLTGKEEPLRLAWKKRRSPRLVVCVGPSFWVSFGGLRIPPFFSFFFFYQTGCTHTPTHAEKRDTPIHRSQSAK